MNLSKFYDMDLVLVCGNYGAGKTHFCYQYFNDEVWNYVNRVRIRRFLYEMLHFGKKWEFPYFEQKHEYLVKSIERQTIQELLWKNQKVLLDKTSITREGRLKYINLAKKQNKKVGILFLNTPVNRCLERNKQVNESHKTGVKESIISELYARLELPSDKEGAHQWMVIDDY